MYCCHCEERLPETANFCLHCGRATKKDVCRESTEATPQQAARVSTRAVAPNAYTVQVLPMQRTYAVVKTGKLTRSSLAKQAMDESDARIRTLLDKAYAQWALGKLREALKLCQQALEVDENHSEIYIALGGIFEACHRFEEALVAYEHAIRIGTMPTSTYNVKAEALERKARIFYEQHRYTEALRAINQSLKLDPRRPSRHKLKHDVLYKLNRFHEAQSAWKDYMNCTY